jgi:hypothetical protein
MRGREFYHCPRSALETAPRYHADVVSFAMTTRSRPPSLAA